MKKCNPVDMRKNLEIVEFLKVSGIDFVAIPAFGGLTKEVLIKLLESQLELLSNNSN